MPHRALVTLLVAPPLPVAAGGAEPPTLGCGPLDGGALTHLDDLAARDREGVTARVEMPLAVR